MIRIGIDLLYEGERDYNFIKHFLRNSNVSIRDFPVFKERSGSGEQYVRVTLPERLKAFRTHNFIKSNCLIVLTDADTISIEKRKQQLQKECLEKGVDYIQDGEQVIVAIPRRNLETWVQHINNPSIIDETEDFKEKTTDEECTIAAKRLADLCRNKSEVKLPSLSRACNEFNRRFPTGNN